MSNEIVKANVAVCGGFHFIRYVKYLEELECLNHFYYAGSLSRSPASLGLSGDRATNIFLKEYLLHFHLRYLTGFFREHAFGMYHDYWQRRVLRSWNPAPVLHCLLHGNTRMLIQRAQEEGAIVVGEPVNAHPKELVELLDDEHQRLGLSSRQPYGILDDRLAEDADRCDYLLTGSEVVKQSFVNQGFCEDRVTVIPYGTDTKIFARSCGFSADSECQIPGGSQFRVISVGTITPRKGHVYLLEAWRQLALKDCELVIIGRVDPQMIPILKRFEGEFTHIPHVPYAELAEFYRKSDVFVLPSIEDGFGYVCAEAMSCGVPVIVTRSAGASELISEGDDGFVVEIRDVEAIKERIEQLYFDREQAQIMGQNARIKAEQRFLLQEYAKQVSSYYQRLPSSANSDRL